MVSNHEHECKAKRTTYSPEVDRGNGGVKSLFLPFLTIPLLLFPLASRGIDVRRY